MSHFLTQNPLIASYLTQGKKPNFLPWPPRASIKYSDPYYFSYLTYYPPSLQSLGSSYIGFLTVSRTYQVYFCLQTFVIAVPSAWNALPHVVPGCFPHLLQVSANVTSSERSYLTTVYSSLSCRKKRKQNTKSNLSVSSWKREIKNSQINLKISVKIWKLVPIFSSVQSLSRVQLFATPWIAARQASLSITNSWSSPKLLSIKLVMPSSHLILYHPLLLLPPIPPSIRVFSNESTLCTYLRTFKFVPL